jgi:S-adenosylmethionine:tRNA ribosyltransferase-isomerase
MKLTDFDYHLPKKLIAQEPIRPRNHSRLLLLNKETGRIKHKHFYDIIDYLQDGDVLVLNNSKVFPARLIGKKKLTGGKIEVLLHQKIRGNLWQCLIGGKGRKEGLKVEFRSGLKGCIVRNNKDGTWNVKFNKIGNELMRNIKKIGWTPLPPYIKRKRDSIASPQNDRDDYQTVYADDKKIGSVAAPTAGFHFTPRLMKKLKAKGVQFEYTTLHVGLGTFAPVKVNDITKHKMHAEWIEVKKGVIERIAKAKREKSRIIAVGTTSVRTLESIFKHERGSTSKKEVEPLGGYKGWVDIFIYPGYKFKVIDGLITNFHLPKSTLLMLVMAFTGRKAIDKAYKSAIKNKYRFYSYGDAMLIY